MTNKLSQTAFLEKHLRGTGRTLSTAQARATYGIANLSARIAEMRAAGLVVTRKTNTTGNSAYSISRRDMSGCQGRIFS